MSVLPSLPGNSADFGALLNASASKTAPRFSPICFPKLSRLSKKHFEGRLVFVLLLMAVLLLTALSPAAVRADDIILGSGAIVTGNQVYFGTYYNELVLWHVMGDGNGGSGMLLLSEYLLDVTQFNPDNEAADANVWYVSNTGSSSAARNWCGTFYSGSFSAAEKSAVLQTSKTDAAYQGKYSKFGSSSLNGEYVFFLSAQEAETYFSKDDDASRIAYYNQSPAGYWWLRSPDAHDPNHAGDVAYSGTVITRNVKSIDGARPAFNLDPSSVLFSSLISSNQYKLTLKDDALKISASDVSRSGSTVTVPCSVDGSYDRIWIIMTDKEWNDTNGWNGAVLNHSEAVTLSDGSLSFTLPKGYTTDWKTYLIAEKVNTGNFTNYASEPVKITIKTGQTVRAPEPVPDLIYSGSAQTLIIAGRAENGTMKYAVTEENIKPSADAYTYTNDSLPTGTDAKTYYVWYMSVGNDRYNDYVGTSPVSVTIAPADPETPSGLEATYGQTLADVPLSSGWEWADRSESVGNVGTNKFKANYPSSNTNYNSLSNVVLSVEVKQAENQLAVIVPLPVAVVWGGNTADLKSCYSGAAGDVTYSVSYPTDHPASGSSVDENGVFTSGNTIGGCIVKVTAAGNTNYKPKTVEITVEVTEKPVAELNVTQENAISGQTLPDPVFEDHGIIAGSLTVSYSGSGYGPSTEKPTAPGSYTVTVSYETMTKLYTGSASFTIIEATHDLTVLAPTFSDVTYGYDQLPEAGVITLSNSGNSNAEVTSVSLVGNGASAFTLNKSNETTIAPGAADTTYTVQPKGRLAAGTYTAAITVESNDGQKTAEVSFTIDPKAVTVTALNNNKYEGETDPDLEAKVTGTIGEEKVNYSLSREQGETPKEYTITSTGEELQGNYKVSFIGGTFTIYAKGSSGFVEGKEPQGAKDLVANGSEQQLLTTTGAADGGIVMYSVNGGEWSSDAPTASEAGSYEIAYFIMGDKTHTNSGSAEKPLGTITVVIADEPMDLDVNFVFITGSSKRGVPIDIKETKLSPSVSIKDGANTVSQTGSLDLTFSGGDKEASVTATFSKKLKDLAPGKYSVSVSGLPKTIEFRDLDGNPAKYKLSTKAEINKKDGDIVITVYLIFKDQSAPEEPVVVRDLPEDEIGSYAITADGTKEYLLFQTYDICMAWLGSDELCRGPERCYHK